MAGRDDYELEAVAERRAKEVFLADADELRVATRDDEHRTPDALEQRRRLGHSPIPGRDGLAGVACAVPAVLASLEVRCDLILDPGRWAGQKGVDDVGDRLLGAREGDVARELVLGEVLGVIDGDDQRGIEQGEALDQLRPRGGELEGEPAAEAVADPGRRFADGLDDIGEMGFDVPRSLPAGAAVATQIGREDVEAP